jgi:hypothetical protein
MGRPCEGVLRQLGRTSIAAAYSRSNSFGQCFWISDEKVKALSPEALAKRYGYLRLWSLRIWKKMLELASALGARDQETKSIRGLHILSPRRCEKVLSEVVRIEITFCAF